MSHECLARMVEHSRKMIETIGKEVENNFITRKGLFSFSNVGITTTLFRAGSANVRTVDVRTVRPVRKFSKCLVFGLYDVRLTLVSGE